MKDKVIVGVAAMGILAMLSGYVLLFLTAWWLALSVFAATVLLVGWVLLMGKILGARYDG